MTTKYVNLKAAKAAEMEDEDVDVATIFLLRRMLRHRNMHLLLSYALELVFLCGIVLCERRPSLSKTYHHLKFFLGEFLPASAIYWDRLENLVTTDAFVTSDKFLEWIYFFSIAQERITLLESTFDRRDVVGMKACDYRRAILFPKRSTFAVALAAWTFIIAIGTARGRIGKNAAIVNRALCFVPWVSRRASPHDFARTIVHAWLGASGLLRYLARTSRVVRQLPRDGDSPLPHSEDLGTHDTLHKGSAEWEEYFARAANGEGSMTIHVMRGREGSMTKYWVVPLRSSMSTLQDGLKRIAARNPEPHDLEEELATLFLVLEHDEDDENPPEFEEIH
ncbi:hypothetical protein C8F04DRAFT_1401866 [Mycena alexandri]|uniref:Uncharacterized protein n=1 Tax=Mycena alexandri TaxID=1745969 RepID=A0AAD6SA07_9AGAR|nr:hypothetical protein C8F04DRAFT_1401866 [Mycena alexandri]